MKKKPKILITEHPSNSGVDFWIQRQWGKNKVSDPVLITDDLGDLVNEYALICKANGVRPDMKLISKIINKYNNKENKLQHYEKSIFKSH